MRIIIIVTQSLHGYREFSGVERTRTKAEKRLKQIGGPGHTEPVEIPDGTKQIFVASRASAGGDDMIYQGVYLDYESAKKVATDRGEVVSPPI
jgi:hypothetical protein